MASHLLHEFRIQRLVNCQEVLDIIRLVLPPFSEQLWVRVPFWLIHVGLKLIHILLWKLEGSLVDP